MGAPKTPRGASSIFEGYQPSSWRVIKSLPAMWHAPCMCPAKTGTLAVVKVPRESRDPPEQTNQLVLVRGWHLPVKDVIILSSPAPILIGKAIDLQKLGLAQPRNTTEVASIGQPVG